jgi:hypothetical protein
MSDAETTPANTTKSSSTALSQEANTEAPVQNKTEAAAVQQQNRSSCCSKKSEAAAVQQPQMLLKLMPEAPTSTFDMSNFAGMVAELPDAPSIEARVDQNGRKIVQTDDMYGYDTESFPYSIVWGPLPLITYLLVSSACELFCF